MVEALHHVVCSIVVHHWHHGVVDGNGWSWREETTTVTMCILLCIVQQNKQTNKHTVVRVRLTLSRAREAAFTHDGWDRLKGEFKMGEPTGNTATEVRRRA